MSDMLDAVMDGVTRRVQRALRREKLGKLGKLGELWARPTGRHRTSEHDFAGE